MNGYSWVSVFSIFCYLVLLLTLVSAKKTELVIKSFLSLLVIMIFWAGGSLFMRLMIWPSVNFWHHVSLLGMLLLPFGYYQFVQDFLDKRRGFGQKLLFVCCLGIFLVNVLTNIFIPLPVVVKTGNQFQFLYHYTWHVYPVFAFILLVLGHLALIIWRHCRGNHLAFRQLVPVLCGIGAIFLGHLLSTFPIFEGFPVDMLSGAVNAVFLFYALYKKKLFRMTILLSKSNYVVISTVLAVLFFSDFAMSLQRFLHQDMRMEHNLILLIIVSFLVVMIAALYFIINAILNALFTRPEQRQQEALAHFSEEITHMMGVSEILQAMSDTIQKIVKVSRMFVLIREPDGNYRIQHTINPLDEKNFLLRADHPLITYFKKNKQYITYQDFCRKTLYRSMWESEKALLINLQIECFIPLSCEDGLTGVIMISGNQKRPVYHPNSIQFLQSASDLCVNAVKNAYNYEKAVQEAQKDELTGLLNYKFFFEILDREFEKHKDTALSLCLFNLDDFKRYNQLYGTHEGDIALQRVAAILASSIGDTGYAARVNGDEFALILPGYDIYSAKCLADNVAEQINTINNTYKGESTSRLTVSAGICAAPYMASSAKELYRNADTTVYTVKRTGKNAVQMYSADIYRRESSPTLYKSGYDEHASTIFALTAAIDAKDHYTFHHSQNVAHYASELAKAAGMTHDLVELIREAGLLHDIGKIGVREEILNKPTKLTLDEFEVMKSHVENAVNIIRHLPSLDYVIPAVLSHHERYDGRGYPNRLAGDNIPITGRILCIADSFDAITSIRNYKDATSPQEALAILRSEAGKQFDPSLVEIFAELVENGKLELRIPENSNAVPSASASMQASLLKMQETHTPAQAETKEPPAPAESPVSESPAE